MLTALLALICHTEARPNSILPDGGYQKYMTWEDIRLVSQFGATQEMIGWKVVVVIKHLKGFGVDSSSTKSE
jgi:hypothetical protein